MICFKNFTTLQKYHNQCHYFVKDSFSIQDACIYHWKVVQTISQRYKHSTLWKISRQYRNTIWKITLSFIHLNCHKQYAYLPVTILSLIIIVILNHITQNTCIKFQIKLKMVVLNCCFKCITLTYLFTILHLGLFFL